MTTTTAVAAATGATPAPRPNIVVVLVDDMGWSDLGCYGSEVATPTIDALAADGVRFSQFYNSARCCPSRAALLTGVHPHQAGVGWMTAPFGPGPYQGYLDERCVTIADALRANGYRTLMSGKWHVGGDYAGMDPAAWPAGDPGHPTPRQRGFDEFYGTLNGAGSYVNPATLMEDDTFVWAEPGFYYTDAIADRACAMIRRSVAAHQPFFCYVAFTAPHWPLHALPEDMARYETTYRSGWDALRTSRHESATGMGLLDQRWPISTRDPSAWPWEEARHPEWEALRMAAYAAQVDRMDQAMGRIVATLRGLGQYDDTLVLVLSDNGGCAEFLAEEGGRMPEHRMAPTPDGRTVTVGNDPTLRPGEPTTFMSYDQCWANASNAPFRFFKKWVHEGGISTPLVAHWPARIRGPRITHAVGHIVDILPTCLDAAGATMPTETAAGPAPELQGESLLPVLTGQDGWRRETPLWFEHEGNRALRDEEWKLVRVFEGRWELYNMAEDRTEQHDLAEREPTRVERMAAAWQERAEAVGWTESTPLVQLMERRRARQEGERAALLRR